ncbi:MAG: AraC family transcriptional regulator [Sphingobacteriales bacterium]|nr:MAG: AraC family transcriptional regulator [Sphingobacteriales bacterium]
MKAQTPLKFNSVSELHKALGLPKPLHPLVSLVNYADIKLPDEEIPKLMVLGFYKVSYKFNFTGRIRYGQGYYDFNEGGLCFYSPNQTIASAEDGIDYSGYTLLFHPDFIRQHPLAGKMKNFGFFSYAANEGLFISDKERQTITSVFENIRQELEHAIDEFSQDVVVSHIEVLLNYSSRFYKRQFITRKAINHDLLANMEQLFNSYFDQDDSLNKGLPTVEYLAGKLNMSPRYLSDMLRSLTGQNAQQHIHEKLIEKAKEYLAATPLSVSEIAFHLGFEHSQSFNKLFKRKTNLTPGEYKQSLN